MKAVNRMSTASAGSWQLQLHSWPSWGTVSSLINCSFSFLWMIVSSMRLTHHKHILSLQRQRECLRSNIIALIFINMMHHLHWFSPPLHSAFEICPREKLWGCHFRSRKGIFHHVYLKKVSFQVKTSKEKPLKLSLVRSG